MMIKCDYEIKDDSMCLRELPPLGTLGGGQDKILRHLNFRQNSRRFTWYFANTSFPVLNASYIVYKNMTILNPSGCSRAPLSK